MHSKILLNNYIKIGSLSFSAVIFLSACGDEYQTKSNSTSKKVQSSYIKKDGLSGRVLGVNYIKNAKVCFDINSNGKCDENETIERSYEYGKYSFTKNTTYLGRYSNLIAEINNEYILISIKNSNNIISPYTTIVVNEKMFNPYTKNDTYTAISDLLVNSSLFKENLLKGEDYIKSNPNSIDINTNSFINNR